ncbi:hypothetical protein T12_11102 [Trichinella patagoniensis]|uniref:Uncharacterized protein n=1 Tax=Trichinella patagoniensis TaxID=990121 RepID=A0A0V0ZJJ8_9BILA|nr:hypothetical protein T12_11102 [Trichinella patagoniensis]
MSDKPYEEYNIRFRKLYPLERIGDAEEMESHVCGVC